MRKMSYSGHSLSLQNLLAYTNTLPIIIPYLNTVPNTLGFCPKPKSCRQTIRIEHEKHLNFVSQSESRITSPKSTRELSARVEDLSRLSVPLGSL